MDQSGGQLPDGAAGRGGSSRVLIASNRGPVSFAVGEDGSLVAQRGGGGLVSGLSSVRDQADVLWVCAALSDADRAAARSVPDGRIDAELTPGKSAVRMLDIPAATFQRAYNSVANSTLWFVHHMLFDTAESARFRARVPPRMGVVSRLQRRVRGRAGQGSTGGGRQGQVRAMVQDYHLPLVPRMLAERRPDIRIAHFSHTPWAPPDYYRLLPDDVGREVLDGILGADHAGFLCQRWADAFLDCCAEFLDAAVDPAAGTVRYRGKLTSVAVHPLGVDADELRQRAAAADVQGQVAALTAITAGQRLIVRVDRTELSKNIVRGLAAYRELLITHPEWRGQVTHLAFAYPSRHDLPEYREYTARVQRMAGEIEDEFGTDDWNPLILQVHDDYPRSLAAYRLADVLLVNPIRDGMNLVAKEGPILSERACALVLSTEAGAAAELGGDALLVNPFDVTQTAEALHRALTMPQAERARRAARLASASAAFPPSAWLQSQLDALAG